MRFVFKNVFFIGSLLTSFSLFSDCDTEKTQEPDCLQQTYSSFNLKHREHRGLGYDTGYTSAEFFVTPAHNAWYQPILDVRGHVFNNGDFAANAGIGVRLANDKRSFAFGIFGFYDFRHFKHLNSSQASIALEFLSHYVDLRINGYLPFNGYDYEKIDFDTGFVGFKEHKPLHKAVTEYAFPSADASLGGRIPVVKDYFSIYLSTGPYYLFRQNTNIAHEGNAFGWRANIDFNVTHWFDIGAEYTYDRIYNSRIVGYLSINIPLGKRSIKTQKGCRKFSRNMNMMTQKIRRNEIIPTLKKDIKVEGGDSDFIFVDNLGVIGTGTVNVGDGTFEHPYCDLKIAAQNANPGDILYVYPGDGTSSGYDKGVTLKNGQNLHSSSIDLTTDGFFIPAQTTTAPTITNTEGSAVTLANNVTVNGFTILNPTEAAITGDDVGGFNITNNDLFLGLSTNGIVVTNINAASSITSNEIQGAKTSINSGIKLTSNVDKGSLTVQNNEITSGFATAFSYSGDSSKGMDLAFSQNTILNPFGNGISISDLPSTSTVTLSSNDVESENTVNMVNVGITAVKDNDLVATGNSKGIQILNVVNTTDILSNTLSSASDSSSSSSLSSSSSSSSNALAITMTQGAEALGDITLEDNTINKGFDEAFQYIGSNSVDVNLYFQESSVEETNGAGLEIIKLSKDSLVKIDNVEINSQSPLILNEVGAIEISGSKFTPSADTSAVQISDFSGSVSITGNEFTSSDPKSAKGTALLLLADTQSSENILIDDNEFTSGFGTVFSFEGDNKDDYDLSFTNNLIDNPKGLGLDLSGLPKGSLTTVTSNVITSMSPIEIVSNGKALINNNTLACSKDTSGVSLTGQLSSSDISGNTITGSRSNSSVVTNAILLNNVLGGAGTLTVDSNIISGDFFNACFFDGNESENHNLVFDDNEITNQKGAGLLVLDVIASTSVTASRNTINALTPISIISSGGTTLSENTLISGKNADAVEITGLIKSVTLTGNTISGSRTSGSDNDGIFLSVGSEPSASININSNTISSDSSAFGIVYYWDAGTNATNVCFNMKDNTSPIMKFDPQTGATAANLQIISKTAGSEAGFKALNPNITSFDIPSEIQSSNYVESCTNQ